ncbi:YSIRK-targeted triacylglycerol lipase [Staphylococcus caprae]|uniref:YSIRK-targeted triacylglycerol lipase n=1 Tax=Staphylococcus caprae TaxID=29380 RepID=UPI000E6A5D09|nr:YSIRK-type signal peptide-containing protein [Staphylococcus caprae]RIM35334.1 YSIRK-type signal peptide-containing protein [Staphylococcus caprae]
MKNRKNSYSIRKLSVGASSIIVASMLFIGGQTAHAAEQDAQGNSENHIAQSIGAENDKNSEKQSNVENDNKSSLETKNNAPSSIHNEDAQQQAQTNTENNDKVTETKENATQDKQNQDNVKTNKSETQQPQIQQSQSSQTKNDHVSSQAQENQQNPNEQSQQTEQASAEKVSERKAEPQSEDTQKPSTSNTNVTKSSEKGNNDATKPLEKQDNDSVTQAQPQKKSHPASTQNNDSNHTQSPKQQGTAKDTQNAKKEAPVEALNKHPQTKAPQKQTTQKQTNQKDLKVKDLDSDGMTNTHAPGKKDDQSKKGLNTLTRNAVATPKNKSAQQTDKQVKKQADKAFPQIQYKNHDPIILVHGFNGYTADNGPALAGNYWGGDRIKLTQELRAKGYNVSEASVSAFGSNYDRAVELYYYIKGGKVDYGAAHAAKYGHDRYGKTYAGAYREWQPGQKIHLIGHSMGGQTVRLLEEMLRNGNPEEVDYQKKHGGSISPLFKGGQDNMISSITTLAAPHNGTHAADVGNEPFIRQLAYDYARFQGHKLSRVDLGLKQWGLAQRDGETHAQYVKRVNNTSKIWKTKDNAFYDLSREGTSKLNQHTSLNPNIVYKTYTGESTRPTLDGRQKADINIKFSYLVTANVIGKAPEKEWRVNDGLVSVISAQHPFNQAFVPATKEIKKGVWQVMPVKHGWDHGDFVGSDSSEVRISVDDLRDFWDSMMKEIVQNEKVTDK